MKKGDFINMGAVTLAFAVLVFYRLGGLTVPLTSYTATAENPTIILDFGETVALDYFVAYFGPQNFHYDLYGREQDDGEWRLIDEGVLSNEVYKWKGLLRSPQQLRYLRLELVEEAGTLHETLFVDHQGQIIVPVNAAEYPSLFDEQGLFDPYLSKTYYRETVFDETFYARTAYEYIHGLAAYETTHPPLGKSLMTIGIRLFGMNPFGWRFMSAVLGILMIPLMYAFAFALFDSRFAATAAAILLAFDCMHFALSRIATIDVYAAFFILLMYYLFLRYVQTDLEQAADSRLCEAKSQTRIKPLTRYFTSLGFDRCRIPLALCGIAMGLAVATKWTGVFAGLGLGVMFLFYIIKQRPLQLKRLIGFCLIFFVAVPALIYIISYRPLVLDPPADGLLATVAANTARILTWHTGTEDTHDFGSRFYEWPLVWRPLPYTSVPLAGGYYSSLNLMGNPAIWWVGLPCLLYCLYCGLRKKDMKAGFLAVAYLAQYLPWFFIGRLTFIYHYYPATLFMVLAIAYTLDSLARAREWGRTVAYGYLALAVAVFVIFYPVISGSPVTDLYKDGLRWLPRWEFGV